MSNVVADGHPRTVLEQLIRERRLTVEEFAEFAGTYAREHGERGTLSVRHAQRLVSGKADDGSRLGRRRTATTKLLERIFGLSIDVLLSPPSERPLMEVAAHQHLEHAVDVAAFDWLDRHAGWLPHTARRRATDQLTVQNTGELLDRHMRRAKVGHSEIAQALLAYYGCGDELYRCRVGDHDVTTAVITKPDWLDLACPLSPGCDEFTLGRVELSDAAVSEVDGECATRRLAEAASLDVRLTNVPLYRLLTIDANRGAVVGTVGLTPFVEYALTMDLLEGELLDAVVASTPALPGALPLRDRYLPDLASVRDLPGRLCAGGVVALCAIARPADPYRGRPDYALLVQERSGRVLNAARRLSVIPKGFHQPLQDLRADAPIGATLQREMEEELFGRVDVDSTKGEHRAAAPMHPGRLSDPMRWLCEDSDRLRMECTAFALNLVSGNFEFAGIVVIDDEEFWLRFGGEIEANWESSGLRLYSSRDQELLGHLIADESWSSEGLFAFLEGLRRLRELDGDRVSLPAMT